MNRRPVSTSRDDESRLSLPDEAAAASATLFYRAAAAFARTRPWAVADDGQITELHLPSLGWDRAYGSILGKAGQQRGLLLFPSLEDFVAFARLGDDDARAAVPLFGVSFEHPQDVPGGAALAERARAAGWLADGENRLPYVLKLSAEHDPQPLATEDYDRATVCLEAVRLFFEEHRKTFREPADEPVEKSYKIEATSGRIEVGVVAPPAGLPWKWGRETPRGGLLRQELDALLERFHAAQRESGAAEDDATRAVEHVREAVRSRSGGAGAIDGWTSEDVRAFLLDFYPAKGMSPDEQLEDVPEHLGSYLEWLIASGRGDADALRSARDQVDRCRDAFLRYARDPQRFSPSKTFLRAAKAEGVDVTDSNAVDAFLKGFRRRLARDPTLLPSPSGPLHRKAWVWTPDQPAPDPRDPCPCGSGRRYRRCCMPR